MEINGSLPPRRPPGQQPLSFKQLRVGQILRAVVIQARLNQNTLLQVGNRQLRVETQAPLKAGQRIEMEVIQIEPKPQLRLRTALPAATPMTETVNAALKQALPKQAGLAPLLANLNFLNQSQQASSALPAPLTEAIKKIIKNLPQRTQATSAEGLKQAIKNSGLFLENRLATQQRGQNTQQGDFKAALMQLLALAKPPTRGEGAPITPVPLSQAGQTPPQATLLAGQQPLPLLPPAPPQRPARAQPQGSSPATAAGMTNLLQLMTELGRQAEGALARLTLLQLAALQQQDPANPSWTMELPVQNQDRTDLFQIIIDEERSQRGEDQKKRWSIMLSFELENLGPIYVKLNYIDDQVLTTVWAENSQTAELIRQEMGELSRRFDKAGINTGSLHCHHGSPPQATQAEATQTVLDIRV